MLSNIKSLSLSAKASKIKSLPLFLLQKSKGVTQAWHSFKFVFCGVALALCLILGANARNAIQGELIKAVTIIICLVLFRVMSNHKNPTEK